MLEYVNNFNSDRKTFQDEVKAYLASDAPLEERWATFLECDKLLDTHYYGTDSMDILSDCLYDDFYIERRQTELFKSIDEQLCGNRTPEGSEPDEYTESWDRMYAKRDEWREAVLKEGYAGFTNDW